MRSILLRPYCVKTIWGGKNLYGKYGKNDFGLTDIAEAWELSGYPGKESRASGGKYDGMTITDVIKAEGKGILGSNVAGKEDFPILIKLIDSADALSVQVHPDDEKAALLGADSGKTEMWIICDAEKDAYIYFGMKEEISPEKFRSAILDGTITEHLNKVPVNPGDTFFIKAGTVHAIGAGITLCEIQQNSDTTYRLYDYLRRDKDGNMRELHIDKGISAADLTVKTYLYEVGHMCGNEKVMVSCPFFTVSIIDVNGLAETTVDEKSFVSLTVTDGCGEISTAEETYTVNKGTSVFVFADAGTVSLKGNMTVVKSRV